MSDARPPRHLLRSIGAVLAGLLAIVIPSIATDVVMHSTGVFPPDGEPMSDALWLLPTAYRIVYGIAGCYLAARLAPSRPTRHAIILGAIGVAVGLIGVAATWNRGAEFGPRWYSLVIFAIPLPCAWVGGRLRDSLAVRDAA